MRKQSSTAHSAPSAANRLTSQATGQGHRHRTKYGYDNIGQLTSALGTESNSITPRLHEQFRYSYDPAGNLNFRTNNELVQTFNVNALNELTNVSRTTTNMTVAGTTTSLATSVTVSNLPANVYADATFARTNIALVNGTNYFTAIATDSLGRRDTNSAICNLPSAIPYAYDANGNLTNDGSRFFTYDDENQLISLVVTNNGGVSTRSDFVYDGKMRRRIRVEYTWGGNFWVTNEVVRYVYDRNLVIQERDGNNFPNTSYTRGSDLSGSFQGAGGIAGLLARTDHHLMAISDSGTHLYYHGDANGNVTALIGSHQQLVARYSYDPFGTLLIQAGVSAALNPYRFSSKEFDAKSGLTYSLYRYYDPTSQRWLNRDPIGEIGGNNLYSFVYNAPVSLIDPMGLQSPVAPPPVGWKPYLNSPAALGGTAGAGGATGPGVFGFGTSGTLATSVGEVGLGTVAAGATAAAAVGGAIGYGASQLPVLGGGTVADFWGDVLYDLFWPKPQPVSAAAMKPDPQAWMGYHNSYERRYRLAEDDCLSRLEKYQDACKTQLTRIHEEVYEGQRIWISTYLPLTSQKVIYA